MIEVYSCPWCNTTVVNVEGVSAMAVFEGHLDEHYARQVIGHPTGRLLGIPKPRLHDEQHRASA